MNNPVPKYWFELGLLITLSVIWGSMFSLTKIAVDSVPPMMLVILRLLFAMPMLLGILLYRGEGLPRNPKVWYALILIGFLQNAVPFTLISWGQQYIASSEAGLLNTTTPMFAFLIAFFVLRQRERALGKLIGVIIGFIGVAAIFWPNMSSQTGTSSALGYGAILLASASYATTPFVAHKLRDRSVYVTALGGMICGVVMLLPLSLAFEDPFSVRPTAQAWWALAVSGVIGSAVGTIIWYRLVRTLGPLAVTSGAYLRATVAVIIGVAWMNEAFTVYSALGVTFVLFGVLLVTRRRTAT